MRFAAFVLTLLFAVPVLAEPPKHWSLIPPVRPHVPILPQDHRAGVRTPVDAFVRERLLREGIAPAPEAERALLIRRVTFDLTGLPPTLAEIEAFVNDPKPDAYERLVERLLASPHYGEKWGRHWLDVARYAETEGFEYDRLRIGAWRFRDYVIDAFNRDMPYDRFVREQIAGDELDPENRDLLVAASFNRLGPVRRNQGNQETAFSRHEVLSEMSDAVGSAFLGLTVSCARCHDHKFDAIPIDEYYSFQAFWAATQEHDVIVADPETAAAWKANSDRIEYEIQTTQLKIPSLTGEAKEKAQARVKELQKSLPSPLETITTIRNVFEGLQPVHVLKRGNTDRPGRVVGARMLTAVSRDEAEELPPEARNPRTTLARAIATKANPLTARVMAHRIWQGHFGTGLVDTTNDLGVNGSKPSHPELLDWLACEFVEHGWSVKHLHRVILHSHTYRQSTRHPQSKALLLKDPNARLLWHFPRQRLRAEDVRDAMLAISGRLNRKAGGPSVVIPIDADLVKQLYAPGQWAVTKEKAEHDRRSVYLLAKRNLRLPFMSSFDQPDAAASCAKRESSTHALQTLELLNGTLVNDLAGSFADRLEATAGPDPAAQVDLAFRLVTARPPTAKEKAYALEFLRTEPLKEFALAMFNLNSFLYVE